MTGDCEWIFYDGTCGLCHRSVLFLLRRGRRGRMFRFAPLQGRTYLERVPAPMRACLPDSLVVWTREGWALTRSRAVLHILQCLGGGWWILGMAGRIVPRFLADGFYDLVARWRRRIFSRPEAACPRVSPEERMRFGE